MNGLTFDLNGKHGRHNFLTISRDMAAGKQSTFVGSQSDKRSQQADDGGGASFYRKAASRSSSSKASNGGGSSYNSNDLDHLVMRYAYDRFHGTEIDNSQWGITLGTDRFSGQKLVIDNRKYTPAQAAQIARGAGFSNYHYGGKRYDTNLFAGGSYRDRKDFDARIAAIQQSKGVKAAQDVIMLSYPDSTLPMALTSTCLPTSLVISGLIYLELFLMDIMPHQYRPWFMDSRLCTRTMPK